MKKSSLSDNPLKEPINDFGTEHYVNGLIQFIENSDAPITIALQGEWGSGKTSLMNKLEQRLCGPDGKFIGINVNTWEYSMLASPEVTIVKILQKLVGALAAPSMKERVGRFFDKFSRATVKAGLGMITSETGVVDDVLDGFGTNKPSELEQLKTVLEESIDKRTTDSGKQSVLVFIDDLDRLNPPVAVEILELLKNIFTLEKCIFILAIDYEVVVKGLKPKFGELTDRNEREFRSFFDKIIQVPFSLPVNNYRPMDFVLDSLEKIGFINGIERENPNTREAFTQIVVSSVGKNPRSIKRLINTLSLLDCIRKCNPVKDEFSETYEAKVILFAIVAIQVCYPKLYRLLAAQPEFTRWNREIFEKLNIKFDIVDDEPVEWTDVLNAICDNDMYLAQHRNDLYQLLTLLKSTAEVVNREDYSEILKTVLYSSSVTGINSGASEGALDRYSLIGKLHDGILSKMKSVRSDIQLRAKRNTGNGGFHLTVGEKSYHVVLSPEQAQDKIVCWVSLPTYMRRPSDLSGKPIREVVNDPRLSGPFKAVESVFDKTLHNQLYWITLMKGDMPGGKYLDMLESLEKEGSLRDEVSYDTHFKMVFQKAANFEQPMVLETICDLIAATHDFIKDTKEAN